LGLDASVGCRCWQDGLVTPPVAADLVHIDGDGYLDTGLPYDGNEELHHRFDSWVHSGCEHKDMNLGRVRVSNWHGYRAFEDVLMELGREQFPVLEAELPEGNGGTTDASAAGPMLAELARFRALYRSEVTVLVDEARGDVLQSYARSRGGLFYLGGRSGVDIGLDDRGMFVVNRSEAREELFRAMRVEQRVLDQSSTNGQPSLVAMVDRDSGARFECSLAVSGRQIPWPDGRTRNDEGKLRWEYPLHLRVETRQVSAEWFAYILEPLEQILTLAVSSGNPVRWC
jgi:hypothetical protein